MLRSPTVGDALRMLAAHQHLNSGGGLAFLLDAPSAVDLGYAIYHPGVVGTAQLFDSALAAGMQILRELCGPAFAPVDVLLPHVKPADVAPWRALFRVVPRFDADIGALRFAPHWLPHRWPAPIRAGCRPCCAASTARAATATSCRA
jgi:hypothetical protein